MGASSGGRFDYVQKLLVRIAKQGTAFENAFLRRLIGRHRGPIENKPTHRETAAEDGADFAHDEIIETPRIGIGRLKRIAKNC